MNFKVKVKAKVAIGVTVISLVLGACAMVEPVGQNTALSFACDNDVSFEVSYFNGRVRVITQEADYDLVVRPSSIGRKYSSESVTFIHDDDRAVLTGADGGPFRGCHES